MKMNTKDRLYKVGVGGRGLVRVQLMNTPSEKFLTNMETPEYNGQENREIKC